MALPLLAAGEFPLQLFVCPIHFAIVDLLQEQAKDAPVDLVQGFLRHCPTC
jgi:hypothetical protein